jgi:hypothetical protein
MMSTMSTIEQPRPVDEADVVGRPRPRGIVAVWWILGIATLAEMLHEVLNIGGPNRLFTDWFHDGVLLAAAGLILARAAYEPRLRAAWLAFGIGMLCWALGEILWDVIYGGQDQPPYPTVSDALWLSWYPFTAIGIALLIRGRVHGFEVHRWMDGLAVMLVVLTPLAALLLQPIAEQTDDTAIVTALDFSYPILDILLIGGILGVYGLLGWHPGRTWIVLGLGCVAMAFGDAAFAIQQARGAEISADYNFVWTIGGLLIAVAAWSSEPGPGAGGEVYGWRAIALPLAAQVIAIGIQIYGMFHELGDSERVVTLIVLAIASAQIIISRPRWTSDSSKTEPPGAR